MDQPCAGGFAGSIWKTWCLAAGGGQVTDELLMWLQLCLELAGSPGAVVCPSRVYGPARAMSVHPLRPGWTGPHWPRRPATAGQKWKTAGGRVAPWMFGLSPSKPASRGALGSEWAICFTVEFAAPSPSSLLYFMGPGAGLSSWGWVSTPLWFLHTTVVAVDWLNWHFCRSPVQVLCWLPCTQ